MSALGFAERGPRLDRGLGAIRPRAVNR